MNRRASHWIFKKMELAKISNMLLKRRISDDFRVHGLGNCPNNSSRNWFFDLGYVSPFVSHFPHLWDCQVECSLKFLPALFSLLLNLLFRQSKFLSASNGFCRSTCLFRWPWVQTPATLRSIWHCYQLSADPFQLVGDTVTYHSFILTMGNNELRVFS